MYYADHFYDFLHCNIKIDESFLENISTSTIDVDIPDYFCQSISLACIYCVNVTKKIIELFKQGGISKHCVYDSGMNMVVPSSNLRSLEFTNKFINENITMDLIPIKFYRNDQLIGHHVLCSCNKFY